MSEHREAIRDHKLVGGESNMCGVTMSDSMDGRAIAELFAEREGITVTYYPAMIRIDAQDKMIFDFDEISEVLGFDMDPYTFQIEMSTHYGRMGVLDERTLGLYGNLEEYMEAFGGVTEDY